MKKIRGSKNGPFVMYPTEFLSEKDYLDKEEDKETAKKIGNLLGQKRVNMLFFNKDWKSKT